MFKIGKLENVENEVININDNTFEIKGENYAFCFDLNCEIEKLREIPMNDIVDFSQYVSDSEKYINIGNRNGIEPHTDFKIIRSSERHFTINCTFFVDDETYDDYAGVIEISFDI